MTRLRTSLPGEMSITGFRAFPRRRPARQSQARPVTMRRKSGWLRSPPALCGPGRPARHQLLVLTNVEMELHAYFFKELQLRIALGRDLGMLQAARFHLRVRLKTQHGREDGYSACCLRVHLSCCRFR